MIDVLHHIPKKNQVDFLKQLVGKMKVGSEFILKDIRKESILSYWNKIHDLLLAGEIGNEMNSLKLKSFFEKDISLSVVSYTKRRMLLYPHFTIILRKIK